MPKAIQTGLTQNRSFLFPDVDGRALVTAGALITLAGQSAPRTYTFPDADCGVLTDHAVVTVAQGGSGASSFTAHGVLLGNSSGAFGVTAVGADGTVMIGHTGADPSFSASPSVTSVTATSFVAMGSNPASAGAVRMPSGATGIVFRNNANNADLAAMGSNASDVLTIGGNYVTTQIGSGGTFIGIGGLTSSFPALQRNAAGLNIRLADDSGYAAVTASQFAVAAGAFVNSVGTITAINAYQGPGTVASTGDWRAKSGFGFAYRNSVNSADLQILASDSSDRALFGDPGNGVMGVLYGSRIGFGGTTSSFPALKRSSTSLTVRLADDSADASFSAGSISSTVGMSAVAGGFFNWSTRSVLRSPADGQVTLLDSTEATFGRLNFGGTTSSFPALKRDTVFIQHRLADDSGVSGAATASLPTAASARDGIIGFDTTLNALVYYVGGNRFKVVGVSF